MRLRFGLGNPPPKAKPITAAQIRATAKKAIEKRAPGTSNQVTLALQLTLTRERAEQLSEEAIRRGVNLETVVAEIVAG